ncbi:hypothetical protein GLU26_01385 [Nanohaloarchaea archaeon]|nr:hypothetical protein [Candidatus Nanohaloarchaea archaeon]
MDFVLGLSDVKAEDSQDVGNKAVNTGRIHQNTQVPVKSGYVITSTAFESFLQETDLRDKIEMLKDGLNAENPRGVQRRGEQIRSHIKETDMPKQIREKITDAYQALSDRSEVENPEVNLRVNPNRDESRAQPGIKNTKHKAKGKNELINTVKDCFASLYSDRKIEQKSGSYEVTASVTIQKLGSSKIKASGTAHTFHPGSGNRDVVTVDQYRNQKRDTIFKKNLSILSRELGRNTLSENNLKELAKQAVRIEEELQNEVKIKWILTDQGKVFVLEAEPQKPPNIGLLGQEALEEESETVVRGEPVETGIKSGEVKVIDSPSHADELNNDDILVADKLDKRWENLIEKAGAIVTNREINYRQTESLLNGDTPVLAETRTGTYNLNSGEKVTVECSVSKGNVWKGELEKTSRDLNLKNTEMATEIYLDVSNAENIFRYSKLPVDRARITDLKSMLPENQNKWPESSKSKKQYVKSLKSGISRVCAAFHPRPVRAELARTEVETFLDDDQELETPSHIELEIKAVERCISELGFENIEISLPPLATVKGARELKSKILEAEPDMENAGVYATVESPEYVIHGEELLQEFQGIEVKIENLVENMKGGLTEIESLDKDSLLQDIIRQAQAQPRSEPGELCVNIGRDTEYVKPSVRADADSIIVKPEGVEKCLAQLTELEDESGENEGNEETDAVSDGLEINVETSIGGTAGEVYDRLAEKGEIQASTLTDQLGVKMNERKIHQALGWLAKEGKISIHRSNNELTYSLK